MTASNEPTRSATPAPAKPEGWYHGKDTRGKYIHFFRGECGKPLCGGKAKNHKRASYLKKITGSLPDGQSSLFGEDAEEVRENRKMKEVA